jgi:CubicO group peptidase (beta-lactamase class C family)
MMKQNDLNATIFGVWSGNRPLIVRALGKSMTGVRANTRMHFRSGSVAISYLSTILLKLVDEKRVKLTDKLSKWLPSLPHANEISLKMLTTMRSGYADYVTPELGKLIDEAPFRHWTQRELLQMAIYKPLMNKPGAAFSYAHTNMVILGMVLRRITGMPVSRLLRQIVLKPLGLHNTKASSTPEIQQPVLHAFTNERGKYEESTYWNPSWTLATGAITTSNIYDLHKSAVAIGTGSLLSPRSHRLQVSRISKLGPNAHYGMGVFIVNSWILQNPLFSGYNAVMAYLPSKHLTVAITTTLGPTSSPSINYSTELWKQIAKYLAPDHAPA